jgi:MFS family permease
MAMVGGAAYLLLAGSMFASGSLVDRWIKSGASATLALKTFLAVGSASAAVFLIGCVVTNARLSVLFLMLASLALGMIFPNMFSVAQTLAGQQAAGRWVGVQNGISGLGAIIAPALTGILVDRTGNFFLPFAITAAISLLGALAWVFLVGPLTPVDWTHRTITAPLCGQPAQYNEVVPSPHPRTD